MDRGPIPEVLLLLHGATVTQYPVLSHVVSVVLDNHQVLPSSHCIHHILWVLQVMRDRVKRVTTGHSTGVPTKWDDKFNLRIRAIYTCLCNCVSVLLALPMEIIFFNSKGLACPMENENIRSCEPFTKPEKTCLPNSLCSFYVLTSSMFFLRSLKPVNEVCELSVAFGSVVRCKDIPK